MGFCFSSRLLLLVILLGVSKSKADDGIDLNLFKQSDYQLKFERMELVNYNNQIVKEVSIITSKYNRSIAIVNITLSFQFEVDDAVVQTYKFMSNEYRTFPMRFAINSCKAISADVVGLNSGFKRCGNISGCPFRKGVKYHACNWYPDQSKLPPFIPNGQYKLEVQFLHSEQEMFVVNAYITIFRPFI